MGDFNDGTNGTVDDYAYDVNGNLIKDLNKNISAITYNHLNLPQTITVTNKGTITYLYDAAGNKLQKKVVEGATQKITDYVGNMIFENNALLFASTEEGRARLNGTTWVYDYMLKDHLGNVRAMITDDAALTGSKLLEENAYYPFGLTMKGISYQCTSSKKSLPV